MDKTLFIGNGINYVDEIAISWDDLLGSISTEDTKLISKMLGIISLETILFFWALVLINLKRIFGG